MEKISCVLVVVGAVLAMLFVKGHCEACVENREWSDCGANCQETCADVASMQPKMCPMICKSGCVCKSGYALNGGQCIPAENCPCQQNATYIGCANCRRTCEDVTNMGKEVPKICTKECMLGCTCNKGYVFNSSHCILEKDCPCPANAHYSECGTGCPLTCENYTESASSYKTCPTKSGKGCFCNEGYVKMGEKGECVLPSACAYAE